MSFLMVVAVVAVAWIVICLLLIGLCASAKEGDRTHPR